MNLKRSLSRLIGASFGLIAVLCTAPQPAVAADEPLANAPAAPGSSSEKKAVDQKDKRGFGKFVSFVDGTLTLKSNDGTLLVWNQITESTKTLNFDVSAGKHVRVENTAEALKQAKAGTWVSVRDKRTEIYVGAKKGQVSGTFVSFKDGRLLLLGKDLGDNSYTRKYGNNLHYNKFAADVPVYESIDGGEYKLIGVANHVLANVREGTLLTVHGEGDDNITLIQIGTPKTK